MENIENPYINACREATKIIKDGIVTYICNEYGGECKGQCSIYDLDIT